MKILSCVCTCAMHLVRDSPEARYQQPWSSSDGNMPSLKYQQHNYYLHGQNIRGKKGIYRYLPSTRTKLFCVIASLVS